MPCRPIPAAIALSLSFATGAAAAPDRDAVSKLVETARVEQKIPGLALLVMQNGKVVQQQGFGLANVELAVPVSPASLFQTGSIGKMFTAALVLKLAEAGRWSLDDPLARYLPGTPPAWSAVTLRMMLNHTSGIANYALADYLTIINATSADLSKIAFAKPLDFPPGTDWRYSNTAYVLLGLAIEKVTGRFYGDLLVEQVFRPLGMATAQPISERDITPNRVAGYELGADNVLKNQNYQNYMPQILNSTADGSLYFSLQDYAAWEAAVLRRDTVLKQASWDEMFRPGPLKSGGRVAYGMGWNLRSSGDMFLRAHNGSWQGFQTAYVAIERGKGKDDSLAVIVLTNLDAAKPGNIARNVAALLAPSAATLVACLPTDVRKPCPASQP